MKKSLFLFCLFGGDFLCAARTPAPEGTEVYFISPENGEILRNPVVVRFGLKGMGVAPAGVAFEKTGHHHLLIDVAPPQGDDLNYALPDDAHHKHFGGGQTETALTLKPGRHTLQLFLGDHTHVPFDPPIASEKITITVLP